MSKEEELSQLQARMVSLLSTMQRSDAHAAKCIKLGKDFRAEYPVDYAEYVSANAEYQTIERRIADLELEITSEEGELLSE